MAGLGSPAEHRGFRQTSGVQPGIGSPAGHRESSRALAVLLPVKENKIAGSGTQVSDVVRNGIPHPRDLAGFHPAPQSISLTFRPPPNCWPGLPNPGWNQAMEAVIMPDLAIRQSNKPLYLTICQPSITTAQKRTHAKIALRPSLRSRRCIHLGRDVRGQQSRHGGHPALLAHHLEAGAGHLGIVRGIAFQAHQKAPSKSESGVSRRWR